MFTRRRRERRQDGLSPSVLSGLHGHPPYGGPPRVALIFTRPWRAARAGEVHPPPAGASSFAPWGIKHSALVTASASYPSFVELSSRKETAHRHGFHGSRGLLPKQPGGQSLDRICCPPRSRRAAYGGEASAANAVWPGALDPERKQHLEEQLRRG
jgi:hypothetical protein